MNSSHYIIKCYGITKDPKTSNFAMVMEYAENGNLRQRLNKYFNSMNWKDKFRALSDIAEGLNNIHKEGLIHQDLHSGNILNFNTYFGITDLGLCKPVNEKSEKNVYPEVLRGRDYTQASDVYSFGIIIYEVFNGFRSEEHTSE